MFNEIFRKEVIDAPVKEKLQRIVKAKDNPSIVNDYTNV